MQSVDRSLHRRGGDLEFRHPAAVLALLRLDLARRRANSAAGMLQMHHEEMSAFSSQIHSARARREVADELFMAVTT